MFYFITGALPHKSRVSEAVLYIWVELRGAGMKDCGEMASGGPTWFLYIRLNERISNRKILSSSVYRIM